MPAAYAPEAWTITKPAVTSQGGLVASQHYRASAIGARVLAAGGNAVDAAVTASFALGAVEPWMSGLGGGGYLLVYRAAERRAYCIDFSMPAPRRLDPADYPPVEGGGADLFNWPAVLEDRNLRGYQSFGIPGYVAGLSQALERFGSRSWQDCLAPAIDLAEQGLTVDWYATLKIAAAARHLDQFVESRRVYLPEGYPPAAEWGGPPPQLSLGALADTLKRLADAGPDDFYRGQLARAIVADVQAGGGILRLDDLAEYRARLHEAGSLLYRDHEVLFAPGLSAGPTLRHAMSLLEQNFTPHGARPDSAAYAGYASCLLTAYAERLNSDGDSDTSPDPGCTSHLSVVDRDGNLVALTQTLLSVFGSKVVLPQTGILMNNGIMWFDPRSGRPNSLAPGKRPLANMCPTVVSRGDGLRVAMGASGGRRILPAVMQLASFVLDYRMDLEHAFRQPRLDVSGTQQITLEQNLDAATQALLGERFTTRSVPHGVYPNLFACPNAVSFDSASGDQQGAAFIPSPWAAVARAD